MTRPCRDRLEAKKRQAEPPNAINRKISEGEGVGIQDEYGVIRRRRQTLEIIFIAASLPSCWR